VQIWVCCLGLKMSFLAWVSIGWVLEDWGQQKMDPKWYMHVSWVRGGFKGLFMCQRWRSNRFLQNRWWHKTYTWVT
jgi:hypothetical protein